jgi:exonuclease III
VQVYVGLILLSADLYCTHDETRTFGFYKVRARIPPIVLPEIRKTCVVYEMTTKHYKLNTGSIVAQQKDRVRGSVTLLTDEKYAKRAGARRSSQLPTSTVPTKRENTIRKLTVGTYNVRTLNDSTFRGDNIIHVHHKIQQITAGCDNHDIDLLAIQEHRLTTTSETNQIQLDNGWTLVHTNSYHECHGVAILFNKRLKPLVRQVKYTSDRIISVELEGNPRISIVSAYAPPNERKYNEPADKLRHDREKDEFYNNLVDLLSNIPPHTITILAGDFNAHIGIDAHGTNPKTIGPVCYYSETNDNGSRYIEMCELANIRPLYTHFESRRSRQATYKCPGSEGKMQQLDHIAISTKWWKSITNIRAFNSINIMSDHKVVSAIFQP